MAQFSRKTILAATDLLENAGHARITRFLLGLGLEDHVQGASMRDRASATARYLIANPDLVGEDGENVSDAVVENLVTEAMGRVTGRDGRFDYDSFATLFPALNRALERDGFTVEDGRLRRALPRELDLPRTDDEVQALLQHFGFHVSLGHLNQAIAAHARGDWAAANGQLRAFVESLLDAAAESLGLGLGLAVPPPGNQRRMWLAELDPPFFVRELNEWTGQGTGFIEGFFRRLHPQGAHPGLSDEEDSTFRLHLVLLTGRSLLRRLADRLR